MPHLPLKQGGFTLLELLVGLAVFAILMVVIVPVVQEATSQHGQSQAQIGSTAIGASTALRQINAAVREADGVVCIGKTCLPGTNTGELPGNVTSEVTLLESQNYPACKALDSGCAVEYWLNGNSQMVQTAFIPSQGGGQNYLGGLVGLVLNLLDALLCGLLGLGCPPSPPPPPPPVAAVLAQGVTVFAATDVNNCLGTGSTSTCLVKETINVSKGETLQGAAFVRDNQKNNDCSSQDFLGLLLFGSQPC